MPTGVVMAAMVIGAGMVITAATTMATTMGITTAITVIATACGAR